MLTAQQIVSIVEWTRSFHLAAAGFTHPGPWRSFTVDQPSIIGHNDIAPYNVCFDGDDLVGVFDWDLAGPTTPLLELAFIAWNCVPLWQDIGPELAASRLEVIAAAYDNDEHDAHQILHEVPQRIRIMLEGILARAATGDQGMANLITQGEPERSRKPLAELIERIPAIDPYLISGTAAG